MEENRKTVSFDSLSTDSSIDRVLADLPIPALRGALRDADRAQSLYLSCAHGVRFLSIAGADKKDYLDPNIITDPLMDAEAIKSDARAYAVSLEFLARGMLLALDSDAGERVFSFVYANACAKKEGHPL